MDNLRVVKRGSLVDGEDLLVDYFLGLPLGLWNILHIVLEFDSELDFNFVFTLQGDYHKVWCFASHFDVVKTSTYEQFVLMSIDKWTLLLLYPSHFLSLIIHLSLYDPILVVVKISAVCDGVSILKVKSSQRKAAFNAEIFIAVSTMGTCENFTWVILSEKPLAEIGFFKTFKAFNSFVLNEMHLLLRLSTVYVSVDSYSVERAELVHRSVRYN